MKPGVVSDQCEDYWVRKRGVGGGACLCVNLWAVVPPAIWMDLEFRNLGRRPGICILGGQGAGAWRVEDGSAGGQRGGWNGLSLSFFLPPSFSLFFPPSACVQLLQLLVSPLTLSGSYREELTGPLLSDNSAGTTTASTRTHRSEGAREQDDPTKKGIICEFSCVSVTFDQELNRQKTQNKTKQGEWKKNCV